MKHLKHMFATNVYSHCNMCNIPIYFCNIHMKHLQHYSKIYETLETYACNMRFQHNVTLLLGRIMEAHRCRAQRRQGGRRQCIELASVASTRATRMRGGVTRSYSPCLLVGAFVVEARRLDGGSRGKRAARCGRSGWMHGAGAGKQCGGGEPQ